MEKQTDKTETEGTKIAAEIRAECNQHSDEERQRHVALAMQMIYHNKSGAEQVVANRG